MLVHTVLFWIRKDLQGDQLTDFRISLETLKQIPGAEAVYIGLPANTPERPVVDTSYDFCLTILFKTIAAHNAYQVHPIHDAFVEKNKDYWRKVKIYDSQ